jgi:replicative DNA helicase
MQQRIPPSDINAEKALLGSIILRQDAIFDINDTISPEMFSCIKNRTVYNAMLSLRSRSEPIDLISLINELKSQSKLEEVGGIQFITNLPNSVPMSTNIETYSQIVSSKYIMRKLIETGDSITQIGFDDSNEPERAVELATSLVLGVKISDNKESTDISQVMSEFDKTQEEFKNKQFGINKLIGISSGYGKIDGAIDGLRPGHFWSIAAYTSAGKTSFLLNIINNLIDNYPVSFFSLEMSKIDIISRLLGIQTGIGITKIMRHEFEEQINVDEFTKSRDRLINSKLKIYSKTNTLDGIIISMTKDMLRNNTKVFCIDYIQLVRTRSKNEYEQITEAAQRLQTFARETGCTIIVLSQVSNEHARDPNQEVHGTKGGGSLPASVDLAIELFNEDKKEDRDDKVYSGQPLSVKAIIKKNRHGRCGYVKLDFTPWNGQFKESTDLDIDAY